MYDNAGMIDNNIMYRPLCVWGGDTCWFGELGVIGSDFDSSNYLSMHKT